MVPVFWLPVTVGAVLVAVAGLLWLVLGAYSRARQRDADRATPQRVTDPGLAAAWAHSRHHPDASRDPFTLDTDPDERGAPVRPALRQQQPGGDGL